MIENVLFTDTMQKAQHGRWDLGWGGVGGGEGGIGARSTTYSVGDGGGDESERWESTSNAFKTQTVMKSYQVPVSSGRT